MYQYSTLRRHRKELVIGVLAMQAAAFSWFKVKRAYYLSHQDSIALQKYIFVLDNHKSGVLIDY